MASIATIDHAGFVVEDITRSKKFYERVFGSKELWTSNLHTRTYQGWPIIAFVELGAHRFEVCLAQHALPEPDRAHPFPGLGFSVDEATMERLEDRLDEFEVEHGTRFVYAPGLPLTEGIRIWDPDGNALDLAVWTGSTRSGGVGQADVIPLTDMCHAALEVTDLNEAERFYTQVLGMRLLMSDEGELGKGRIAVENETHQVIFLELVESLSPRSYYSGPDPSTAPVFENMTPFAGAHIAITVNSPEEYDDIAAGLRSWRVLTDGDVLAGTRAPDVKTEYFYDPTGNRIQLVCMSK